MNDSPAPIRSYRPTPLLEGAGVRLKRSFPTRALNFVDPFLLLDDFSSPDPEDFRKGFPWHPHRGIQTVTYLLAGAVEHRDSLGNAGRIAAGDAQWMTAGGGIMHEEMPDPEAGALIGFQLWVNLPAKDKMTAPAYGDILAKDIPVVTPGQGATVRVLAGEAFGVRGPVYGLATQPTYLDVHLQGGTTFVHALPAGRSALAYLFEGEAAFGHASAESHADTPGHASAEPHAPGHANASTLLTFENEPIVVRTSAREARYLWIAGRPLGEPVVRYGPMVMNTRKQIEEALRELEAGTFVRGAPPGKR
ncbi:MAG: pirin family protein [Candidatus Eisenbacteria bacterium]|nr:pirin family protein [Candidatus Eisenbacteria bacterium]